MSALLLNVRLVTHAALTVGLQFSKDSDCAPVNGPTSVMPVTTADAKIMVLLFSCGEPAGRSRARIHRVQQPCRATVAPAGRRRESGLLSLSGGRSRPCIWILSCRSCEIFQTALQAR